MKVVLIFLLALAGQSCFAQSAWVSGELNNKQGQFVGTSNDSGGILTQNCYYDSQSCYWSMSNGSTNCETDESYPALINSDAGAISIEMYCYKAGGMSRMTFTSFEQIDEAIKKSKKLAVAVPLQGGNFKVTRFELSGANTAILGMRRSFLDASKKSTKDLTL